MFGAYGAPGGFGPMPFGYYGGGGDSSSSGHSGRRRRRNHHRHRSSSNGGGYGNGYGGGYGGGFGPGYYGQPVGGLGYAALAGAYPFASPYDSRALLGPGGSGVGVGGLGAVPWPVGGGVGGVGVGGGWAQPWGGPYGGGLGGGLGGVPGWNNVAIVPPTALGGPAVFGGQRRYATFSGRSSGPTFSQGFPLKFSSYRGGYYPGGSVGGAPSAGASSDSKADATAAAVNYSSPKPVSDGVLVTCTAAVNIAVIKYWGKRDTELMLPLNSSLSATLSQDDMRSKTTIMASKELEEDEMWLNGERVPTDTRRMKRVLTAIRANAGDHVDADGNVVISRDEWDNYHLRIVSENDFPTAAGLASSASGYCCLVATLARLFGVEGELSAIARLGSGSACRSMYGGWVRWEMGVEDDGSDSIASQVAPEDHWPGMNIVVLVVNAGQKHVSSTAGMQQTAKTSPMMPARVAVVPHRMRAIEAAILDRDFDTFGEITMNDSDHFHATCHTTDPEITYLNEVSFDIIAAIRAINAAAGRVRVAYTFDAGPNAVLYLLDSEVDEVLDAILSTFPPEDGSYVGSGKIPDYIGGSPRLNAVKRVIKTTVGDGPRHLPESEALIDPETGLPRL